MHFVHFNAITCDYILLMIRDVSEFNVVSNPVVLFFISSDVDHYWDHHYHHFWGRPFGNASQEPDASNTHRKMQARLLRGPSNAWLPSEEVGLWRQPLSNPDRARMRFCTSMVTSCGSPSSLRIDLDDFLFLSHSCKRLHSKSSLPLSSD